MKGTLRTITDDGIPGIVVRMRWRAIYRNDVEMMQEFRRSMWRKYMECTNANCDLSNADGGVNASGSVRADRIASALSPDGILSVFGGTALSTAAALGAEAAAGGTLTAFELACDNAVNAFLKKARRVNYGSEPLTGYVAAVENEITAVRMILTGRLAGVKSDVLRERLRDMYA